MIAIDAERRIGCKVIDLRRSGRHFLAFAARADRFVHRHNVRDHCAEHQKDGCPKPPIVMDRPIARRRAMVFVVSVLLVVRHF
jgi:hypothetical protein